MSEPVRPPEGPSEPVLVDITQENVFEPAALEMIARFAALGLHKYGQCTFVVRPDGGIAFANPAHVHIHPQAIEDLGDRPIRYLRPIIGDGRPSYVGWKDGILWEVELKE